MIGGSTSWTVAGLTATSAAAVSAAAAAARYAARSGCFNSCITSQRAADALPGLIAAAHIFPAAAKVQKLKHIVVLLIHDVAIIVYQRLAIEDPVLGRVALVHGNVQPINAALVELFNHTPPVFHNHRLELLQ